MVVTDEEYIIQYDLGVVFYERSQRSIKDRV